MKHGGVTASRTEAPVLRICPGGLARFDEHWRVILDADDPMLVWSLAKRGYLDVLKRRVPLYRLSDLGQEVLQI